MNKRRIDLNCKHIKEKPESLYIFDINDKQSLNLCPYCFEKLAIKINEQLITELLSQRFCNKIGEIDIIAMGKRIDNLRDYVIAIDKRTHHKK